MTPTPSQRARDVEKFLAQVRRARGRPAFENLLRRRYARWGHAYFAFLARFLRAGYAVKGYDEFRYEDRDSRTLYIQHDVHWLDIPGALCMMDMERQLGVRSSYSVMWDYRPFDVEKRDDYLLLRDFADGDFDIGLHEAVLDEYFFEHHIGRKKVKKPSLVKDTRNHLGNLISSTTVPGDEVPVYLEPDPIAPNLLVFRDAEKLPDGIFKEIISASYDLLERRLDTFRTEFGKGSVIHQHGGYVAQAIRDHWDDNCSSRTHDSLILGSVYSPNIRERLITSEGDALRQALSQPEERDRYGTLLLWLLLTQGHRYRPDHLLERLGILHDSGKVMFRCLALGKYGRVEDCLNCDSAMVLGWINKSLGYNRANFSLLHATLWDKDQYEGMTDPIVAAYRDERRGAAANPGDGHHPQSALAHYRAALGRRVWPRYCRRFGDDWLADETAATGYLYSAGNFQARARRVWDLLAQRGLTGLLDGGTVIDLGGGLGTISSYLACQKPLRRLRVVDIDAEYLEFQDQVYEDLGWDFVLTEQSAFRDWQGGEEPADLVLSYGAFEFFHDDAEIARIFGAVARSLRPGGVFVANVWNHHYPIQGYSQARYVQYLPTQALRLRAARMLGRTPNEDFRSLSHARWRAECLRAGLAEPEVLYCDLKPDGFHFFPVTRRTRGKRTHIWVLARKPQRTPAQ